MHLIVLGRSVIGTTTAYYLACQGAKVTVLDRQPRAGNETSYAVVVSETFPASHSRRRILVSTEMDGGHADQLLGGPLCRQ
jgi:glycine/D-amino acid oxidase-like deaminating enzyme